jgi:hypothetical protein
MMTRRDFSLLLAAAAVNIRAAVKDANTSNAYEFVARTDRVRILTRAENYLKADPVTITAQSSTKSHGGRHDYFSQADYYWPNPADPNGPYIYRDGLSNPENFLGHRLPLIDFSVKMPCLTAAWMLTKDTRYAEKAVDHLRAWFINPSTRMNPNLEYGQAIQGVVTGTKSGIIDTLHLVEVARATSKLGPDVFMSSEMEEVVQWFRKYLHWLTTSEKGRGERTTPNNHATCWALQAAEYARLTNDRDVQQGVWIWYTTTFLRDQVAANGSFPKELTRTKPYSYSIFNFDVMATLCQSLLSFRTGALTFSTPDGKGVCKAAEFIYPYLEKKSAWP